MTKCLWNDGEDEDENKLGKKRMTLSVGQEIIVDDPYKCLGTWSW